MESVTSKQKLKKSRQVIAGTVGGPYPVVRKTEIPEDPIKIRLHQTPLLPDPARSVRRPSVMEAKYHILQLPTELLTIIIHYAMPSFVADISRPTITDTNST